MGQFVIGGSVLIDNENVITLINYTDINSDYIWLFDTKKKLWYTLSPRNSKRYLLHILYPNETYKMIKFKNNNHDDYRRNNIEFIKKVHCTDFTKPDSNIYKIIEDGVPIKITDGKFAKQWRNMYWYVEEIETEEKYFVMDCKISGSDDHCIYKFSKTDLQTVLDIDGNRPVWYKAHNGYITTTYTSVDKTRKMIYLHQLIMNHKGNGRGQMSVDHINQDKLDNRKENLRIVDQTTQNQNTGKRKRQHNACKLPEGIEQSDMPKYISYRRECYNKKNNSWREYFCIEKHPDMTKRWSTKKSMKYSVKTKLEEAKIKLNIVNKEITEEAGQQLIEKLYI